MEVIIFRKDAKGAGDIEKKGGQDRILQIAFLQHKRWAGTALEWADVVPMEVSITGRMSHSVLIYLHVGEEVTE